MLYIFTVLVNFIALAVAVWLGIYIITRSPRSAIAWLAGFALWSLAGFCFNVLLALNPPPSPAHLPLWMRTIPEICHPPKRAFAATLLNRGI